MKSFEPVYIETHNKGLLVKKAETAKKNPRFMRDLPTQMQSEPPE